MEKTFDFEKIGNRMPYSVPDDFFTKLEESVMDEVKVQRVRRQPYRNEIRLSLSPSALSLP